MSQELEDMRARKVAAGLEIERLRALNAEMLGMIKALATQHECSCGIATGRQCDCIYPEAMALVAKAEGRS